MMKTIFQTIRNRTTILGTLLLLSVIGVSYGQTLKMYFWQDDSALIFKLQHLQGQAGSFGEGIIGSGPYKYLVTPFVPFYPVFGLNPLGYFLVGFLGYIFSAAAFYLFTAELLKSRKGGFFATLIFSAGYIGSDIMFRIINSWQSTIGMILALLTLWTYLKFLRTSQSYWYYLLSLGFFLASVEFVYIRSHSLVFPILALDILISLLPFRLLKLIKLGLKQIPFLVIFYLWYLKDESAGSSGLKNFLSNVLGGKIEIISGLFASIGNIFIPDIFQSKFIQLFQDISGDILIVMFIITTLVLLALFAVSKKVKLLISLSLLLPFFLNQYFISKNLLWYRAQETILAGAIGMYFMVIMLVLGITFWKKERVSSLALIFGLLFLVSQAFGYYIQYPEAVFGTTHRYLNYSFIGYSILLGTLSFAIYQRLNSRLSSFRPYTKLLTVFFLATIVLMNTTLSFIYQYKIIKVRSKPGEQFYKQLLSEVPNIQKGAIFYFDVAKDTLAQQQFRNFFSVGSMPESTALAIYYNIDRYDLSLITDSDELLSTMLKNSSDINNLYTFSYNLSGLVNTTSSSRSLLKAGSSEETLEPVTMSDNTVNLRSKNITPVAPLMLTVNLSASKVGNIRFPYSLSNKPAKTYSLKEREEMFNYLESRKKYYQSVSAASISQWKYQETGKIIDNNSETSWRGHRIWWHDHHYDQVNLDLGRVELVSKLLWVNWNHTLTPTTYKIEVSVDGNKWDEVKKVVNGPERKDGESVLEELGDKQARFVRFTITATLSDDAPSISEIEIVDSAFKNIDLNSVADLTGNPFGSIENQDELDLTFLKATDFLNVVVQIDTDSGIWQEIMPITGLDKPNVYNFFVSAGGTKIKSISLGIPNAPVKLAVHSATLKNLSLKEITDKKLFKKITEI